MLPGLRRCGDLGAVPLPKLRSLRSQLRLDLEAVDGVSAFSRNRASRGPPTPSSALPAFPRRGARGLVLGVCASPLPPAPVGCALHGRWTPLPRPVVGAVASVRAPLSGHPPGPLVVRCLLSFSTFAGGAWNLPPELSLSSFHPWVCENWEHLEGSTALRLTPLCRLCLQGTAPGSDCPSGQRARSRGRSQQAQPPPPRKPPVACTGGAPSTPCPAPGCPSPCGCVGSASGAQPPGLWGEASRTPIFFPGVAAGSGVCRSPDPAACSGGSHPRFLVESAHGRL